MSGALKTGRVMVKDEDVCLHCGLCAERCPTGAWDMRKFLLEMTHAGRGCRTSNRSGRRHEARRASRGSGGVRQRRPVSGPGAWQSPTVTGPFVTRINSSDDCVITLDPVTARPR